MAVEIPIEFPGTTQSTEELNALVQAMVQLGVAESASTEAAREFNQQTQVTLSAAQLAAAASRGVAQARQAERDAQIAATAAERGAAQARQEYNDRTREAAAATARSTQEQTAASTAAINLTTRIAGLANGIQGLVTQFGGQSRAAGLAGAIANNTAHFAQLGAAVGPGGAVVGGIIGALIPAIQSMRQASDAAVVSSNNLNASLATLISRAQQARAQMELTQRLESGGGTVEEQGAYQQRSLGMQRQVQAALGGDAGAIRALRQQGVTGVSDNYSNFDSLTDLVDSATGGTGHASTQLADTEREALNNLFDHLSHEIERRGELMFDSVDRQQGESNAASVQRAQGARGGGGGASAQASAQEQLNAVMTRTMDLRTELAEAQADAHQELIDNVAAESDVLDWQADQRRAEIELTQHQAEAEERLAHQREQIQERDKERTDALMATKRQQHEEEVRHYQETTGTIVGGIVQAGVAIASGAESASSAFKHLLAGFLEYISQRSALEAAAQFAMGVASFASQDYGGGVLHMAAGVGFTAVAIAAGAGGAILNQSAAQEAAGSSRGGGGGGGRESPARVPSGRGGARDGGGGGPVNIFFNSPVVTAGTESQLARRLRGMISSSETRYPSE